MGRTRGDRAHQGLHSHSYDSTRPRTVAQEQNQGTRAAVEGSLANGQSPQVRLISQASNSVREVIHMNPVTSFLVFALAVGGVTAGYRGNLYLGIALLVVAALVAA